MRRCGAMRSKKVEAMQSCKAQTLAERLERLESRIDIMHQEAQRTAESLQRLRLVIDGIKGRGGDDSQLLQDIHARLCSLTERSN